MADEHVWMRDVWDDQALEAARVAAGVCIRLGPRGAPCAQPYDHTGPCDWWDNIMRSEAEISG